MVWQRLFKTQTASSIAKQNPVEFIKIKTFVLQKTQDAAMKMEREAIKLKKMFAKYISDKGLESGLKNSYNSMRRQTTQFLKNPIGE